MKKSIILILIFFIGFLVGQLTHIYTFNNNGLLRLNTITGDVVLTSKILQKKHIKMDLSSLNLEKE